ncbi:uncharacterized protein RCC_12265 [Ramularia collo-cygni]|uniref:ADP-ribose 1''-phosphate phosphatase n=1 Tax=Ramularia collo-cygni TaxID=112498 RepID=A0A2D3URB4_9PEZI|nr:uncharacterized protein RCC_12265 [Ramularia collo-cygni]CZT14930.1 uncharacterized protein RCC_12265 [Ramularia collo-cygni]
MSSSTASTVSKRRAEEDETSQLKRVARESKRLKTDENPMSSNGQQNISRYFACKDIKTRKKPSPRDSDDGASKSRSASSERASAKVASQRKDGSISPPPFSLHRKPSTSLKAGNPDASGLKACKNEAIDGNDVWPLKIKEHVGDIFAAPSDALLIHACNCKGWWGKGIAADFKKKYPAAFKIYQIHCKKPDKQLIGKALLIPPQPTDRHQHYVGCIFTSLAVGYKVDPPHKILGATATAMTDLLAQARSHISDGKGDISEVRIFNSGLFKVEWKNTLEVLKTEVEPQGFGSLEVFSMSGG